MVSSAAQRPEHVDEGIFGRWVIGFWQPHGASAQAAVVFAVLVNCAIVALGSKWLGMPSLPGFDGSILHQPSPLSAFLTVAVLLVVTTLVGTVLAGAVRFEAGLFAGALSLAMISFRCGTMQTVLLQNGGDESVYLRLAVELVIFWVLVAGVWLMLWRLGKANFVRAAYWPEEREKAHDSSPLLGGITAATTQIVTTGILLMLLCQSEAKKQALVSVGLASMLGAMAAYKYSPARPSIWFWSGPFVVGLLGYILAAAGQFSHLEIGSPTGFFAALARPLPIDYASMGPAGAILGYWWVRKKVPGVTEEQETS